MSDPKILGRDDFLADLHLKRELVEVPDLGGSVYLQELSGGQLLAFNARVKEMRASGEEVTPEQAVELMAMVVVFCVCDAEGQPVFTKEDAQRLVNHKLNVLMDLSTRAFEISGLNLDVAKQLGSEVAVNLKKGQKSFSYSNLRKNSGKRRQRS